MYSTTGDRVDSDTLKMEILKHRSSITEATRTFSIPAYREDGDDTDGDVDMLGATPLDTRTLRFSSSFEPATAEIQGKADPAPAFLLSDLLLYTNPALSGLVALSGLAVLALGHYLLSGSHGWRLLPSLAHAALGAVGFNLLRGLVIRGWTSNAAGSSVVSTTAQLAAAAVCGCAMLYDTYMASPDPSVSLQTVLTLWLLSQVGRVLGVWSTITLLFVASFTVPVALATFESQISEFRAAIGAIVQTRWNSLGLTRRQKGLGMVLALGLLWTLVGWPTRLTAVLAGALAIRANLRPAEVEAIISTAEPYTQSVKKKARRLSRAAAGFASSRLGRPSIKERQL